MRFTPCLEIYFKRRQKQLRSQNVYSYLLDRICGDIFTARSGSFKSPQHPSNYPSNATCLWQIKVPGASQIRIEFDNFQLEEGQRNSPVNCNSDYLLYLLDGQFPSAFGVKKRCGRDGAPIVFDGDKAWLEFVSDDVNNYSGFSARYNAVMKPGSITDKPFTSTKSTGNFFVFISHAGWKAYW